MSELKRICAITMARNDDYYLQRWVEYYGRELGRENLYIFLDGKDLQIPDFCGGVSVTLCDKLHGNVVQQDKGRIDFLSDVAATLFKSGYDMVIGVDADEILVVDPILNCSLVEFLSRANPKTSFSGIGVDVGQNTRCEGPVVNGLGFLEQRRYGLLCSRYTKSSVITKQVRWGRGFHRIKGHNFHILKDLYLFHFGYLDLKRIEDRFMDKARVEMGAQRHLKRRTKSINIISSAKRIYDWDRVMGFARVCQTYCRKIQAWNKPSIPLVNIVVRIPDRFKNIV